VEDRLRLVASTSLVLSVKDSELTDPSKDSEILSSAACTSIKKKTGQLYNYIQRELPVRPGWPRRPKSP
jgi:hypothetical protein